MKIIILTLLVCICTVGVSFGQIKITGNIYSDSTLTKPIPKVKLIIKCGSKKEVYKTDKFGRVNIATKLKKFSLEIKKDGYMNVSIIEISKDVNFNVILKKALSLHDINYEGQSKLIIVEK